jgi:hypothetical protein
MVVPEKMIYFMFSDLQKGITSSIQSLPRAVKMTLERSYFLALPSRKHDKGQRWHQ